jgi:hypothetical protein
MAFHEQQKGVVPDPSFNHAASSCFRPVLNQSTFPSGVNQIRFLTPRP